MPEIPGMNLRLPVPTPRDQGPQDIPRTEAGRQARGGGQGTLFRYYAQTLALPSSIWGTPGRPRGPCQRQHSLAGVPSQPEHRGGGWASWSPARILTTLTSTSSHASSRGWHPRAAARHLLPERKAHHPSLCGETDWLGFQKGVQVKQSPPPRMWADQQAVCPVLLPCSVPSLCGQSLGERALGF